MHNIILLGSGNLATHLAQALHHAGYRILQVYSPTADHADTLAAHLGAEAVTQLSDIRRDADTYIISVKDDAVPHVADALRDITPYSVVIHTAGSVPLDVLRSRTPHSAVLYPLQTFTKTRPVDFNTIPCFIEYTDDIARQTVKQIATSLTTTVVEADSEKRRRLHLAAVFASNMTNHCYRLAQRIIEAEALHFSLLYPLMNETTAKAQTMSPRDAQTGPMARHDITVMEAQKTLLNDDLTRQLYDIMAQSIYEDKQ